METERVTLEEAVEIINEHQYSVKVFFEEHSICMLPTRAMVIHPSDRPSVLMIIKGSTEDSIHISSPGDHSYILRKYDGIDSIELNIHIKQG